MFNKIYLFFARIISDNIPFVRKMRYEVRRQVGSSQRILEVGCALGGSLSVLRAKDRLLIGVDNDIKKIKIAQSMFRDIQFSVMDANSLGFPNDAFDVVIFSFTLHEIDDYVSVIGEACRVSRKVIITDMGEPRGVGGLFFRMIESEKLRRHIARDYDGEFSKYGFVKIFSGNISKNVFLKVYSKSD